ncbi:phosphotransferase family protein [Halolamina salifodinae]|uniref:Aminoglycoside phosphotransferase (APT) family kinase protein n=1 Tax=Halolamina salifodinae TaxID=1202767 RepID=A0A8T4GVH3_9EURY|nr:phosphotransferase [Halolamina salifodinae]MBP1986899.1 aminoglycoside phosphotransferase (APT) family kinase protein [Halolamina salifodinae]
MDEQVSDALQRAFPGRAVADVGSTGPSWNDLNRTVELTFEDGETVYLKISTTGDGERVARERAVIDYVDEQVDVPVPTIAAADPTYRVPYLATEAVDGESLIRRWAEADTEERSTLVTAVGRTLATLHGERFEAHGRIVGGGADGLTLEAGSWTDVLIGQIEQQREIAPAERFSEQYDAVIDAVDANRDRLDEAPAALLHGDPAHPNGFLTDGRVGLLDWEISHVGDPARELHRAHRQLLGSQYFDVADRVETVFLDAYRETAGSLPTGFEQRQDIYEAVGYLGRTGFFSKWAPDVDRPEDELAAEVEAEMERRLENVR